MERVGFHKRFFATMADTLISAVIVLPLAGGLSYLGLSDLAERAGGSLLGRFLDPTVIAGVIVLAYAMIEVRYAASPGKMLMGLTVRRPDTTAANAVSLFVRNIAKYAGTVVLVGALLAGSPEPDHISQVVNVGVSVGCLLVLTNSRQALHDMFGHTAVFEKAALAAWLARYAQPASHCGVRQELPSPVPPLPAVDDEQPSPASV